MSGRSPARSATVWPGTTRTAPSADDFLLRELLEGRLIPAAAVGRLDEGNELLPAGHLAAHPAGTAAGWRINGVRDFVSFASASQHLLVPVPTGDGVDLFAVRRGAGVTVADMDRLDLTDRVQRVMFDDAPAARLRLRPDGFRRARVELVLGPQGRVPDRRR